LCSTIRPPVASELDQQAAGGGLAAAGLADQAEALAVGDLEVDPVDRVDEVGGLAEQARETGKSLLSPSTLSSGCSLGLRTVGGGRVGHRHR
jgi:hypothetical protein